ncbi:MAG TPA: magnesium transporter CorA [Bacteroidetes bacterium]|nr:magnesium transporter CorA [Bacteroidota bacterium]
MIKYYKTYDGKLKQLDAPESDCWINIYPPFNHENLKKLSEQYTIPIDFLIDSLDIDERSRFEHEDDVDLIVLKIPLMNESDSERDAKFITIPLGIILVKDIIITISPYENQVVECFLNNNVRNYSTLDRNKFVLQVFDRCVFYFLYFLKEINNESNAFERELYSSMRNEELLKLLKIEKSLVYFVTSLRANELMMLKVQRTDFLKIKEDEEKQEFFSDTIIDTSQALEMANTYTNILSGTMDAFASIISNNLNVVMKRLTSVTIVLTVPTLISSLYGMNVHIPYEENKYTFYFIMAGCVLIAFSLIWLFKRLKWW